MLVALKNLGKTRALIDYFFLKKFQIWGKYKGKSITFIILVKFKNLGEIWAQIDYFFGKQNLKEIRTLIDYFSWSVRWSVGRSVGPLIIDHTSLWSTFFSFKFNLFIESGVFQKKGFLSRSIFIKCDFLKWNRCFIIWSEINFQFSIRHIYDFQHFLQ